jgi:cysteine desulfurase
MFFACVDKRVAEKMMKYLTMDGDFGNPASNSHYYGWQADEAVKAARKQVADLIGAQAVYKYLIPPYALFLA